MNAFFPYMNQYYLRSKYNSTKKIPAGNYMFKVNNTKH